MTVMNHSLRMLSSGIRYVIPFSESEMCLMIFGTLYHSIVESGLLIVYDSLFVRKFLTSYRYVRSCIGRACSGSHMKSRAVSIGSTWKAESHTLNLLGLPVRVVKVEWWNSISDSRVQVLRDHTGSELL